MLNRHECDEYMKFTCEFLDTIDIIKSIRTCRGPATSMMDIERNYRDTYKNYCKNREAEGTLPEIVKKEDDTIISIFNCMDEYEFGDYVKDRYKISYTEETIVTTVWNTKGTFMTEVETLAKNHNWNLPTRCSVCGADLVINANHKELKCSNEFCKSRYMGRISKWTDTLKIKEFGLTTIEKMIDNNIFKTIPDLYKIDYAKIASMDGFGEKSAAKMKSEIDSHKEATLAEFIAGFNITDCGENIIQNVIDGKGFNTLDAFLNAKVNDFIMDGLKEKTADKLYKGIQALKEDMIETTKFVKIKEIKKVEGGSLGGQSFCFTGPAQRKRSELWEIVEKNGGIVHESCKRDTNFLVMADKNSTSSKAEKARKNGTTMLSEEEFIGMCEVL